MIGAVYKQIMSLNTPQLTDRFDLRQIKTLSNFYDGFFSVDTLKGESKLDAWKMLVDPGLNRQVIWTPPGEESLFAPKLTMMNRHGLIARILDRYINEGNEDAKKKFRVLMFDIQDFSAYNIKDASDTPGGDYMANIIAQSIKMTCDQYLIDLKYFEEDNGIVGDQKIKFNITPARYGGDEFAVLIDGDISEGVLTDFKTKLIDNLNSLDGYVRYNNGNIGLRGVRLKNNEINPITMPEDTESRGVFVSFLRNNILLDETELEKILKDPEACFSVASSKVSYPKDNNGKELNLNAKLAWITSKDSAYSKMISHLCQLDSLNGNETYRLKALKFFELTMYNDIFQRKMLSYQQFVDKISDSRYKAVCVFDISWLKEMNDINMARGDLLLRAFFDKITSSLGPVQSQRVDITRKGGTFIVGIKDNNNINLEKVLEDMRIAMNGGLDTTIGGMDLNVPCGYSHFRKSSNSRQPQARTVPKTKFEESNTLVTQTRNDADRNKIENLCLSLLRKPEDQSRLTELLQKKLLDTQNKDNNEIADGWIEGWFWLNYLTGKLPLNDTSEERQIFPARYTDRCKSIKDKIRLLSITSSSSKTEDTKALIAMLEELLIKMRM
jgi:GGDEF domain-containing protein